ncbi:RagB/SusD family nutrient uptake outer membrane protein [Chitinophaga sedimenti]|uniref:RagB/SusD family nutrient uptake outer membrane protein n=1 Tax=Chitinophaga sedimenti TaxID=2033606 RepID=UPI0020051357|nr:RagB/SusD family nutrient uptake outer membrane protein [Chitinophaga sedimenti]MCK7556775.1 RagB/SusD family nutrient uptake outer membrane protein [Chitinophaga sedimenti]
MYCNAALEGISKATISDDRKPALMGEAIVLRAMYYYVLTCSFGDVPFYTENVGSLGALEKIAKLGRMPAGETRKKLIAELQEYVPHLPQARTADVPQNRISAPIAYMLIGKMALWEKDYTTCTNAMEEIRKIYGQLTQYSLTDTYFRNKNTGESIFEVQYIWSAAGLKRQRTLPVSSRPPRPPARAPTMA